MVRPLKQKTRKKNTGPLKSWGLIRAVFTGSLPYILSLTVVGLLFGGVYAYAVGSPTFQLSEVKVLNIGTLTPSQAFQFCELRPGENLVSLDLVNVQQVIKRKHPEFKEVRVRRVLPNRIEVVLKRRTPLAQVAFSRYVQIDKDLVMLPGSSPTPFRNLTSIKGAPLPREGLFIGVTLTDEMTRKAVKLAEVIKRSNVLRRHLLTEIDISDPRNVFFVVDGAIEIRIGNSHFIERLKILDQTLRTVDLNPEKIQYIDLRFDDVVIGPR